MTPEAQRIAIAEVCGWTESSLNKHPQWIPDYTTSLDAMHEAETVLRRDNNHDGCGTSALDCYAQRISKCATASQRAEAFLRTFGKWVES
jgi:hypothetical protein